MIRYNYLAVFGIIVVLIALGLSKGIADTVSTNAEVANSLPVGSSAILNNGSDITLTAGTTTTIVGSIVVTDSNGCDDLTAVEGAIYRTGLSFSDPDDGQNHYSNSCVSWGDCGGGADLTETYDCSFDIQHYADPTDTGSMQNATNWTFEAIPEDNLGTGSNDIAVQEINTLLAMDVQTVLVDFGSIPLGGNTNSTNPEITIINDGNEQFDLNLNTYGDSPGDNYSMTCDTGEVNASYMEYNNTAFDYGEGTDMTGNAIEYDHDAVRGFDGDTQPDTPLYLGYGFPSSGVSGTCEGIVVVTAVGDPYED